MSLLGREGLGQEHWEDFCKHLLIKLIRSRMADQLELGWAGQVLGTDLRHGLVELLARVSSDWS